MNPVAQPERRILVIANRTCPCPTLAEEVARRASAAPTEVLVVAPALNSACAMSRYRRGPGARARAPRSAITALRQRGVIVRGEIGDANPLLAIADALASFPADEIVITTLPTGRSNWIERGLVEKATARFAIPIVHLVSSYDLVEEAVRTRPARAAA